MQFSDRHTAGRLLGKALSRFAEMSDCVVIAIPRGGVLVGQEVASVLGLPFDVIVTKKIGAPGVNESAVGSVSSTGQVSLDDSALHRLGVDVADLQPDIDSVRKLVIERSQQFQKSGESIDLQGKTIILVDDGIATGHTMHAAISSLREARVFKIILATPVASEESIRFLELQVDEIEVLHLPVLFHAVDQFYEDFNEVTDDQVTAVLSN
ncbi:MAG: phosphoribosyltransferase [Candidatus Kerfeldbacteria bacterium CG15_BIG_FIL_POST_REV_8_21_14_020_45_12]|uniref:Phosphoribosyltransferase n=1 Tax=Candidatus Kerfeldbacteria bacterium CG15_BIG_FIL_POST_REV_8_21_14_020_45_12 TaxID=2014247 RepID=A0A2M7H5F9_9BACT|nr:MAG: phosphoribosyltransferase [Candidatus Kerfeldbacteria bacterium CG15_BIG_FIL_POST_REV_8_21_14_020_45_12]PJA93608.1 MAG: phosphoribosyltransferase [Candidatus Kerfeldbacteria bacterium CG_4_9_14_3_um_filter_45_8]